MVNQEICYNITKSINPDSVFFVKKGTEDEKKLRRRGLRDLCINCFHRDCRRSDTPCKIYSKSSGFVAYGSINKYKSSHDFMVPKSSVRTISLEEVEPDQLLLI
jgi:hypothetical protein